jgi:putative heme-binding domain-containing protein
MSLLTTSPDGVNQLISIYRTNQGEEVKRKALVALGRVRADRAVRFLQEEYHRQDTRSAAGAARAGTILRVWAERPDLTTMPFLVFEGLFHDDPEVVRVSAAAVVKAPAEGRRVLAEGQGAVGREPQADLAADLMTQMIERPQLFRAYDDVLGVWSGLKRGEPASNRGRLDEATRNARLQIWKDWFEQQFKRKFEPVKEEIDGKSDEAVHQFLLSDAAQGGRAARGAEVYERAQCHTCHGGGATPGREGTIFGPDLAGVTRRLSRLELADSLVYPSRQVADRFKGVEIETRDGEVRTGFVTEDAGDFVTLAERDQVRRIARNEIKARRAQTDSLMPTGLLNRLTWDDLRDLLAFLDDTAAKQQAR